MNKVKAESRFSVWVGGGEVNEHLLTEDEAKEVAKHWKKKGYNDVKIQEYK